MAINTRLDELGMTQQELSAASGVSTATLREIQRNRNPRRRSGRTLAAISTGLRWEPGHLGRIADGASPEPSPKDELAEIWAVVADLGKRVERLEKGT